jgi:hypothetical protein
VAKRFLESPFPGLRERLLRAGVAPRHVRRYVSELTDHLEDLRAEEELASHTGRDAESAALARLGSIDSLADAMTSQRQFQSWSACALWAVFSIGPLVLLAAIYFIACCYLWCLWHAFLPGADTPFGNHGYVGPIYGFRNICFQAGKFFYTDAPILAGWTILIIAGRQRMKAFWPIAGASLAVLIHSCAQIYAGRTTVPGGLGHIRMGLAPLHSAHEIYGHLLYALVAVSLAVLPYLLWRMTKAFSVLA